eukprot:TRINITY_DN40562_c0_g1_i1.p1 TRINITY_DN40562_c0_g1~~TRINITY_DN40562_c0_g1_i1.p1  ORF type:complete len:498 (+),score=106.67 TRINITY_DN40562_c0_g1_i1:89-1582(+)
MPPHGRLRLGRMCVALCTGVAVGFMVHGLGANGPRPKPKKPPGFVFARTQPPAAAKEGEDETAAKAALADDDGADLTPSPPQPPCNLGWTLEEGAWYEGSKLPPHPTADSPDGCGKLCLADEKCTHFVYRKSDGACHKMSGTRGARHPDGPKPKHISGQCVAVADTSAETLSKPGVACSSLARGNVIRNWWRPGDTTARFSSALCSDQPEVLPPTAPPPPEGSGASAPTAAVGKSGGWVKAGLSLQDVASLRRRGVLSQWYVDRVAKVAACLVPKAGCTGWKAWMLRNAGDPRGGMGNVHNRSRYKGPRLVDANRLTDEQVLEVLNGGKYFKFTVVRNPYVRSLATYLERFYRCQRRGRASCLGWLRSLVGDNDQRNLQLFQPTFADYLNLQLRARRARPMFDFKVAHWLPSVLTCGLNELPYDVVVRLDVEDDADVVYSLSGHPQHTAGRGHSQGTSRLLARFYTASALATAHKVYQADLDVLGYRHQGVVPEPVG